MGGQQSKENNLDKLQDSRDAMKTRDENHMQKNGKEGNLEFVPRQADLIPPKQAHVTTNAIKKRPSIQCTEN